MKNVKYLCAQEMLFEMKNILYFALLFILSTMMSCEKEGYTSNEELEETGFMPSQEDITPDSRSTSDEQNLLKNGNLEKWGSTIIPDWPDDWSLPSNDYAKCDNKVVFEGRFSAKMQSKEKGETARLEQRIEVSPGQKLRIRFHYYVEQWKAKGARTYCYFRYDSAEKYTISADELQSFYGKANYYIIRGGGYNLTYLPHDLNVWLTFDETIEVPPTAKYFLFGINSYYGTTIYVDDCYVIDVTEQTPTGIIDVKM